MMHGNMNVKKTSNDRFSAVWRGGGELVTILSFHNRFWSHDNHPDFDIMYDYVDTNSAEEQVPPPSVSPNCFHTHTH